MKWTGGSPSAPLPMMQDDARPFFLNNLPHHVVGKDNRCGECTSIVLENLYVKDFSLLDHLYRSFILQTSLPHNQEYTTQTNPKSLSHYQYDELIGTTESYRHSTERGIPEILAQLTYPQVVVCDSGDFASKCYYCAARRTEANE